MYVNMNIYTMVDESVHTAQWVEPTLGLKCAVERDSLETHTAQKKLRVELST